MNREDYELAERMITAYNQFISGHHVERVRAAAEILAKTRPISESRWEPFWENPDGPEAA